MNHDARRNTIGLLYFIDLNTRLRVTPAKFQMSLGSPQKIRQRKTHARPHRCHWENFPLLDIKLRRDFCTAESSYRLDLVGPSAPLCDGPTGRDSAHRSSLGMLGRRSDIP
jgi:hypothetical protein